MERRSRYGSLYRQARLRHCSLLFSHAIGSQVVLYQVSNFSSFQAGVGWLFEQGRGSLGRLLCLYHSGFHFLEWLLIRLPGCIVCHVAHTELFFMLSDTSRGTRLHCSAPALFPLLLPPLHLLPPHCR